MDMYDLMNRSLKSKKSKKKIRQKLIRKSLEKDDNFEKIGSSSPVSSLICLDSSKFLLGNSTSVLLYKNKNQASSLEISSFVNR